MKRITSKQISKAIEAKTGHKCVQVYVDRAKGYCYFYNDEAELQPIHSAYSASVMVTALSDLRIDSWVNAYEMAICES